MSESELSDNFMKIADLPRDAREQALHDLASTNPELAAEIRSLLDHEPSERDDDALLIETFDQTPSLGTDADSRVRIPGFKMLEPLAFGGQSVVYLAEQRHPRRLVAIKILGGGMTDDRARERFIAEAELQGTIRHPAIVGIHACGVEVEGGRSTPWIAMELVPEARTIIEASRQDEWTREERLLALATVADAIHAAHLRGVVHRDLKPGNILVGATGRVRIIDFGIARLLDATDRDSVTREGELLGTIRYLAPEQLSGSDIDARADIYSLGVLACELLNGESPYGNLDTTASFIAAIQANAIELPEARSRMARDTNAVLSRAMSLSPRSRYESMAAFARELRNLATGNRVEARVATTAEEFRRFAFRNPLPIGLTVLLFIAIVAGLIANTRLVETARELSRSAIEAENRASKSKTRELLNLASAAVLQRDESLARRLLAEINSDDYSFARGLLESEAGTRTTPVPSFDDISNLYAMTPVPGTSYAVVAGSAAFGMLDLESLTSLTFSKSLEGLQRHRGIEIETIQMDPGSTKNRVRVAAGTTSDLILIIDIVLNEDGKVEKTIMHPEINLGGSSAKAPTFLSPSRLVHGLGLNGIEVVTIDEDGTTSIDRRTIHLEGEISSLQAIDKDSVLVGYRNGRLRVVDLMTEAIGDQIDVGFRNPIDRIILGPRREKVVMISGREARLVEMDSIELNGNRDQAAVCYELVGSRDKLWNATFDPKGNLVAVTGRDGNIRFYSTSEGKPQGRLPDLDGCGWSLIWTDTALLASTEANGIVHYPNENLPMANAESRIFGFSPSGRSEFRVDADGWSVSRETGPSSRPRSHPFEGEILAASVADTDSQDSQAFHAIAAVADRGLFGIDRSNQIHQITTPEKILDIRDLALARDGRTIYWIDGSEHVRRGIYEPEDRKLIDYWQTLEVPDYSRQQNRMLDGVQAQCLSLIRPADPSQGEEILVGTSSGILHRTSGDLGPERIADSRIGWLLSYAEAADPTSGDWFAGGHNGDVVRHRPNGEISWGLNSRRTSIVGLAAHPDGLHLVVLGSAGTIDIVDAEEGERICTLGPVSGEPMAISIDEDGQSLKVHSRDGSVKRWSATEPGREIEVAGFDDQPGRD